MLCVRHDDFWSMLNTKAFPTHPRGLFLAQSCMLSSNHYTGYRYSLNIFQLVVWPRVERVSEPTLRLGKDVISNSLQSFPNYAYEHFASRAPLVKLSLILFLGDSITASFQSLTTAPSTCPERPASPYSVVPQLHGGASLAQFLTSLQPFLSQPRTSSTNLEGCLNTGNVMY